MSGARDGGGGGGRAAFDYFREQVLPAVFLAVDTVFPEFGFRRLGSGAWQGRKCEAEACPLGVRGDRVYVGLLKGDYPAGFAVAGGDPVSFLGYLSGNIYSVPRGAEFFKWAAELAGRAGVDPGPLGGAGAAHADPETMRRAREQLERQRRREEAKARKNSEAKISRARELWDGALEGHEAIAAYFRARGIVVEDMPRRLKFLEACPVGDAKRKAAPAVVAAVTLAVRTPDGRDAERITGIHRLYLKADYSGIDKDLGKMMLGAVRGGAVRLGMPTGPVGHVVIAGDFDDPTLRDEQGRTPLRGQQAAEQAAERLIDLFGGGEAPGEVGSTLCLCEGIETGMAIRAATGMPVWACLSAGGLKGLAVPAGLMAPGLRVSVAVPERWAPAEWVASARGVAA